MDKSQWMMIQGDLDLENGDYITWSRSIGSLVEETIITFSDIKIIKRYPNASFTETEESREGSQKNL